MAGNLNHSYKVLIPLYNVELDKPFNITFPFPDFVPRTLLSPDQEIEIRITLIPWDRTQPTSVSLLKRFCDVSELPKDFDRFQRPLEILASAMLIIDLASSHFILGAFYTDEDNCFRSFVEALKLFDDSEPNYSQGFYFNDNKSTGWTINWPLKEIQGTPLKIDADVLNRHKDLFFKIWFIETTHKEMVGHRVLHLAKKYYLLSSTQTEYDVIFIFLMISFEALFKRSEEEDVNRAVSIFRKLIADTKQESDDIWKFMSPQEKGCCYLRNGIVHGNENAGNVSSQTFWLLKSYLRRAIVTLIELLSLNKVDRNDYYESLHTYAEQRFNSLTPS